MNMKCDLCGKEYEIGHKSMNEPWIEIVYKPLEGQKRILFLCDECDAFIITKIEEHGQQS